MIIIDIVAHNLTAFQGINRCIQYLSTHPHFFTFIIHTNDQIQSDLYEVDIRLKTTQPKIVWNFINSDHSSIMNRRRLVSSNIHTILSVDVFWKVQIQPAVYLE